MPGSVFRTNLAVPMSAPVLPALTQACARPSFTRSMAMRIEECFLVRMAVRTSSSMPTTSAAGTMLDAAGMLRDAPRASSRSSGLFQAHEQQLGLGIGGEEVEAGGDGDRRPVVPTHGVDGDDGFHCGVSQ